MAYLTNFEITFQGRYAFYPHVTNEEIYHLNYIYEAGKEWSYD